MLNFHNFARIIKISALLFLLCCANAAAAQKTIQIKGIYGHPGKFWEKGIDLRNLGVNSIFLHDKSITPEFMLRAKKEGMKVFAEFATLNGKPYVETHPEAWAIDRHGNKVEAATWFMGVCPTEPGFRQYRIEELKKLIGTYDVDGVWMDYVQWHAQFEDPEPILPETCFCSNCLSQFQSHAHITLPEGTTAAKADFILDKHETSWRQWRCQVIAHWVKNFKQVLNQEKPGLLLGIYHCPWDDADFNGARKRILGLDYDLLREHADVFSPMVYHGRMGRSPEWVKQNIEWFSSVINQPGKASPMIWPIVQAYDDPAAISAEDFEKVLRYGLSGNANGVMMFTSDAVANEKSKTEVMKKVYSEKP